MIGREKRVVALEQYLSQVRIYDPVLDGLRSAVRYDRTYFDKIVASLLPLLEKPDHRQDRAVARAELLRI